MGRKGLLFCINVSQMLPVPGSKVKYLRKTILRVLRALAVFRAYQIFAANTASARIRTTSISGIVAVDTPNALSTREYEMYSILRVCSEYEVY